MNGRHQGLLYRALNPVWARAPLSGAGAARHGGRFNRQGRDALYTSLSPHTAIREANQVGTLQPTTLVAYRADVGRVFDAQDEAGLAAYSITAAELADPAWRDRMLKGEAVPTQESAERLIGEGFVGLLVRSFAAGTRVDDRNLVLWSWGAPDGLIVVDDEDRLRH